MTASLSPADTLRDAVRRDWRWYAPMYALAALAPPVGSHLPLERLWARLAFGALSFAYSVAFLAATRPLAHRRSTLRQFGVLVMLAPLLVFQVSVVVDDVITFLVG
jgi:hypothetical protein